MLSKEVVRRIRVAGVLLASLTILISSGCTDTRQPTGPTIQEPAFRASTIMPDLGLTPDKRTVARFTIDVDVVGSLVPAREITVRATVTTRFASVNPEIYMVFPEVEAAQMSSWDRGFRLPSGQRLTRRASRPLAKAPQGLTETVGTIVPRSPGYYRVVLTAKDSGSRAALDDDGSYILNTTHKELWFWVAKGGGTVTESFDPTLFPPGALVQPGPLRFRRPRTEAASLIGSVGKAVRRTLRDWGLMTPSYVNYKLEYWNIDSIRYDPVPGAYYDVDHIELGGRRGGTVVGTSTGYSTGSGTILFECLADEFNGSAMPDDNYSVWIYNGSGVGIIGDDSDCDQPQQIQLVMDSDQAHVFTSMQAIALESYTTFGYNRGELQVRLNPSSGSYYSSSSDKVVIRNGTGSDDHVWDSWGQFTMAHEYGHALHEKGLGGNAASGQCGGDHAIDESTNLKYAFSEGWADFHGNELRGDYFGTTFETNYWYPGGDGSTVEGAVAAFFTDLVDSGVEAHDSIDYPHSYLAGLVKTCKVWAAIERDVNGVDFFVYCAENDVDGDVVDDYFRTRFSDYGETPTDYSENVSEPGSWDADQIRNCWLENLYDGG